MAMRRVQPYCQGAPAKSSAGSRQAFVIQPYVGALFFKHSTSTIRSRRTSQVSFAINGLSATTIHPSTRPSGRLLAQPQAGRRPIRNGPELKVTHALLPVACNVYRPHRATDSKQGGSPSFGPIRRTCPTPVPCIPALPCPPTHPAWPSALATSTEPTPASTPPPCRGTPVKPHAGDPLVNRSCG
jgi:hypothetical protein